MLRQICASIIVALKADYVVWATDTEILSAATYLETYLVYMVGSWTIYDSTVLGVNSKLDRNM